MGKIAGKLKIILFFICSTLSAQQNFESFVEILNLELINLENQTNLEKYRVLFSRAEDVYLIFYDKLRKEIFVQYKKDKYDDLNEKIKYQFISGQPYEITVQFRGIIHKNRFFDKNSREYNSIFKKTFDLNKQKEIIFVFQFINAKPLVINEINL